MRILHVTEPVEAGVARHVADLAAFQNARGLDVAVACPAHGELWQRLASDQLQWMEWPASPGALPRRREVVSLRRIVDAFKPDVVHLHSSKAGLVGRGVIRSRVATMFSPHAWSFQVGGLTGGLAAVWERQAARWTAVVVAVSDDEARLGVARGVTVRTMVARNGVDLARLRDPSDREAARMELSIADSPVAVCVGRLCEQKGQRSLAGVWETVRASVPSAQLYLVGDGPDREALSTHAADGVHVVGHSDDVASWLCAADVAVQPSRWEGLSYVTLEALAAGRPVVAYDVGGMREAIGPSGVLVDPGAGPEVFQQAVVGMLQRRADREEAGRRARERMRTDFDPAAQMVAITDAARELTGELVESA